MTKEPNIRDYKGDESLYDYMDAHSKWSRETIAEITKQAAHWHEAYGKSEAENAKLKMFLEAVVDYDKSNQIGSNGWEYLIGQIEIKLKALEE